MKENNYENQKLFEENAIKEGKQRNLQGNNEFKRKIKEVETYKVEKIDYNRKWNKCQEIISKNDKILSKMSVNKINVEKLKNEKVKKISLFIFPFKIKFSLNYFFSAFKPLKSKVISFRGPSPGINGFFSSLLDLYKEEYHLLFYNNLHYINYF